MPLVRLLLALLLLAALAPAAAAQGGVAVTVDAGYDGYYATDAPTPVRVRLANQSESFRARVELVAPSPAGRILYYTELDLPRNSSKVVTFYPSYTGFASRTQVRVLEGATVRTEGEDALTRLDPATRLYGVMAPDTRAYLPLLGREGGARAEIARLATATVPDRADALGALDSIIVDGADTSALTEGQRRALAAWVGLGGRLIVAGGPDAALNAGGLDQLVPVTPGEQREAGDLAALSPLAGNASAPAGGTITRATPEQGARVLAGDPSAPLVVARDAGRGSVTWLAWSPSEPPFNNWEGSPRLLSGLAAPPAGATSTTARMEPWTLQSFLGNIAGAQLPPTGLVAGFLLLYTVLIGPVLYLILKRRDKRELAWVLVPAITVGFSVLAYGANFLIRGTGTALRTLEIVEIYPGAPVQRVTTHAGLFSPGRRDYDLALAPGLSVRAPSQEFLDMGGDPSMQGGPGRTGPYLTVETGERQVLRDVAVDVYSLRTFTAERVEAGGAAGVDVTLTGGGDGYEGVLRNTSGAAITHAYFVDRSGLHAIGAVAAGEERRFDDDAPTLTEGFDGAGPPEDWQYQQLAQSMYSRRFMGGPGGPPPGLGPTEVLVLAFQEGGESPISVLDDQADTHTDRLLVLHADYELRSGPVQVPLAPETFDDPGTNPDPIRMSFQLPEGVTAEGMTLTIDPFAGEAGMGMEGPFPGPEGEMIVEAIPTPAAEPGMIGATPVVPATDGGATANNAVRIEEFGISVLSAEVRDTRTGENIPVALQRDGREITATLPDAPGLVSADGEVQLRVTVDQPGPLGAGNFTLEVDGRKE